MSTVSGGIAPAAAAAARAAADAKQAKQAENFYRFQQRDKRRSGECAGSNSSCICVAQQPVEFELPITLTCWLTRREAHNAWQERLELYALLLVYGTS
jgi:hypothetical protein